MSEKINYTPVIICIERELMQLKHALGMVNVYGLTPTEQDQVRKDGENKMEPYREALISLKSLNHDWTDQEKMVNALTNKKPFTVI